MAKRKNKQDAPAQTARQPGRRSLILLVGGIAAASVVAAVAVVAVLLSSSGESGPIDDGIKTAVIVDQLELTQPNPQFISDARGLLAEAGYRVDYVAGENVTVDFYRTLPGKHYDLILLRAHAGITTEVNAETGERTGQEYVSLFTGEPYDETKYSEEQLNRLGKATYEEGGDPLFGIGPKFVDDSMDGNFNDAVIVMMGCDGLKSQVTAEAFLGRGASAFVSWSAPVSAPHTDEATEKLLQRFAVDQMPLEQAVQETATELGPDPTYEGELRILTG